MREIDGEGDQPARGERRKGAEQGEPHAGLGEKHALR